MPDASSGEIACPACGRTNPANTRTCHNCATLLSARLSLRPAEESAWHRDQAEHDAAYAAELSTVQDGAWREVSTETRNGALPLPPQVRAEALRREREYERREAEQKAATRLREERDRLIAERAALTRSRKKDLVCANCGTPAPANIGETGTGNFSFCLSCGSSFVVAPEGKSVAARSAVNPAVSATVASPVGVLQQQARRELRGEAVGRTATLAATGDILPSTETTPYVAAILSFLMPGLGQIRNGQFAKGGLLLIVGCLLLTVLPIGLWSLTALILRALIALDAFRIADRKRRGETVTAWQWEITK